MNPNCCLSKNSTGQWHTLVKVAQPCFPLGFFVSDDSCPSWRWISIIVNMLLCWYSTERSSAFGFPLFVLLLGLNSLTDSGSAAQGHRANPPLRSPKQISCPGVFSQLVGYQLQRHPLVLWLAGGVAKDQNVKGTTCSYALKSSAISWWSFSLHGRRCGQPGGPHMVQNLAKMTQIWESISGFLVHRSPFIEYSFSETPGLLFISVQIRIGTLHVSTNCISETAASVNQISTVAYSASLYIFT